MTPAVHLRWGALVVFAGFTLAACADTSGERRGGEPAGATAVLATPNSGEPCSDGEVRDCTVTLGEYAGILSCYEGSSRCVGGEWTECAEGAVSERPDPRLASLRVGGWMALSDPSDCFSNPCNPYCQRYVEEPTDAIETTGSGVVAVPLADPLSAPEQSDCQWGNDCQYNQKCLEPQTASDCAHSKCVEGERLNSTCRNADPCVAAVCAERPSCCASSGAWDGDCVSLVKTECDAFCGTPVSEPCLHHVCDTGQKLECNNECVSQVCAIDSTCCTGSWSETCKNLARDHCGAVTTGSAWAATLTGLEDVCGYAMFSASSLELRQNSKSEGLIGARGSMNIGSGTSVDGELEVGGSLWLDGANISVNATVAGDVSLQNNSWITSPNSSPVLDAGGDIWVNGGGVNGDVVSNATPNLYNGATFTGSWSPRSGAVSTPAPSVPTRPINCGDTSWTGVNSGSTVTLLPGTYGNISVNPNGRLKLSEGAYHFQSLTLGADAILDLSYGSTGIDINVCSGMTVQSRVQFVPQPSDLTLLRWYYNGTYTAFIDHQGGSANPFPGIIIAPNATVQVQPGTGLKGVIYAKSIWYEPGLAVLPNDYASRVCGSLATSTCDPGISMTVSPSVSETGVCEAWEEGQKDTSCTGADAYDIGLGMPCDGTFLVCNHGDGSAPAPAGIRLSVFDTSHPWAEVTPNTSGASYLGDCVTDQEIPSGECITQACDPSLLAGDRYVVARAPSGGPSECSSIENWTHYDASATCACFWGSVTSADIDLGDPSTCTLSVPAGAAVDTGAFAAKVIWGDATTTNLTERADSGACGSGGFYLDDPAAPTTVTLCSNTCAAVAADGAAVAQSSADCLDDAREASTTREVYEPDCGRGRLPVWGELSFTYSAPSDSSILFEVRTALSSDELAAMGSNDGFVTLATVTQGDDDEHVCYVGGGEDPSLCPILFYDLIDSGDWEGYQLLHPLLELRATVNPSSDGSVGATLTDWQVTFTCQDVE